MNRIVFLLTYLLLSPTLVTAQTGSAPDDNSTTNSQAVDKSNDSSNEGAKSDDGRSTLSALTDPQATWDRLFPYIEKYGVKAFGALVVLIIAWIFAGLASRVLTRSLNKANFDETLSRFFAKLVRWLVLILGLLACLSMFGVETTSFAAVLGAAGFAVGLALQGTLSNFSSGVMLLVFRPFKVGDVVNVAGQTGTIFAIELFTTTMDTFDNRRIVIPNGSVFGATIENITHHPHRRAEITVGCDYAADVDKTREVLEKAAASVPGGLEDPAPAVVLLELGASSVDWSVRVWAKREDFGSVKQATIRAVKNSLDEAGISIPFPQMDVHLDPPAS